MSTFIEEKGRCTTCGTRIKDIAAGPFNVKELLQIRYCPQCESYESQIAPLSVFKGTALQRVNPTTGEFRLGVEAPAAGTENVIVVRIFPYNIPESGSKGYPELSRNDEVIVVGYKTEDTPLISVMLKNRTRETLSEFIDDQIALKKGWRSSFSIRNPILVEAEKMIQTLE